MINEKVKWDEVRSEFLVTVPFSENWQIKAAPSRKWDRKLKVWRLPKVNANVKHLQQMGFIHAEFSEDAWGNLTLDEAPKDTPFPGWYPFPVPPYKHQREGLDRAWNKDAFALFHEMGMGKTYQATALMCAYHMSGTIDAALVVCPTPIKAVWPIEIAKYVPEALREAYDVFVMESGAQNRMLEWAFDESHPSNHLKILVCGIESFSQGKTWEYAMRFVKASNCMMILDESSRIKNSKAARTDRCISIGSQAKMRIALTGTPVSQGIEDLFSQIQFLDWKILGAQTFMSFRSRYCVMGGFEGRKIVGYQNVPELMETLSPYAHYLRKKDVFKDIPDKIFQEVVVQPTTEQKKATLDLKQLMKATVGDHEIKVKTVLERMTRYQQIVGGLLPYLDDEGEFQVTWMPGDNPKLDAMEEIISDLPNDAKVIIWAKFRPEIEVICRRLHDKFGGGSFVEFHGGVESESRAESTKRFMEEPDVRFIVSNQATGGMGQTLTAANYSLYYSNSFSYQDRVQSEDRAHGRLSALTNKVTFIDIRMNLPVDKAVKNALSRKTSVAEFVGEALADDDPILKEFL